MNPENKSAFLVFCLVASLVSVLASRAPAPETPLPTSTLPQPTKAERATLDDGDSMFKAGLRYSDTAGDMAVSFLDVVAFQAAVNEEAEILKVVLHLRDIPPTAPRRQIRDVAEYMLDIAIFLDPSTVNPVDPLPDYGFMVLTAARSASPAEVVPINQLWDENFIFNAAGENLSTLDAVADPDTNTLTLTGHVPGIKSSAVFSFGTVFYDGTIDRPDNYVSPASANLSTPQPKATQALETPAGISTAKLHPAGAVHAYPGPEHYAGDVLTFEMTTDGSFGDGTVIVSMTLDNEEPTEVAATSSWMGLLLPLALDTTNLSGRHTLEFRTANGHLNETYSLNVLPADQRPPNEQNAAWLVNETACCVLHYISETAAARDIAFIAEHFQEAAQEFATITGSAIDPKLNVYIMDRIWGNGGFGGNGELVISYTDRYYGPTMGGEGIETLARHEFTHAADIGLAEAGDGVDFNYEGLAVYVAGGHYKPEPLAERGAALFDLGYYVPVGQFLNQHELAYLYPAAMLTYIDETYGIEKMWTFLGSDDNREDDQPGSLEAALQATFGVSLKDFDQAFQAWLESKDPGEQLDDLRLTIELQDLRREYQNTYSPPPAFLAAKAADAVARPEYLPVVIREARAPANLAVELIIANGQQAILRGDYASAERLNKLLAEILSNGEFEDPLAKDYLDIVLAAAREGYEVVNLDIQGDRASAGATVEPPSVVNLELQKLDGNWQIQP
jgi:hypothetical protein